MKQKWTDKELRILKAQYGKVSTISLQVKLGKSQSAIANKVHYLRKRGWTFNA